MWSESLEVQVLNECVGVGRYLPFHPHAIFDHTGLRALRRWERTTGLWDMIVSGSFGANSPSVFPFLPRSSPTRTSSHFRRRSSQQCVTNLTERK